VYWARQGGAESLALTVSFEPSRSYPVCYRGDERKFRAWAAHDARAFRRELDRHRCCHTTRLALADPWQFSRGPRQQLNGKFRCRARTRCPRSQVFAARGSAFDGNIFTL
jgi:hypothetical protein